MFPYVKFKDKHKQSKVLQVMTSMSLPPGVDGWCLEGNTEVSGLLEYT